MYSKFVSSSAIALVLSVVPAFAQQQPSTEEKSTPSHQSTDQRSSQKDHATERLQRDQAQDQRATSKHGAAQQDQRQGTAQQNDTKQPSERVPTQVEHNKGNTGTAESKVTHERQQGTAQERSKEPSSRTTEGPKTPQGNKAESKVEQGQNADRSRVGEDKTGPTQDRGRQAGASSSEGRVQLSEDQRVRLHETVIRTGRVNRLSNVNVAVEIGSRVPRTVRLAALPTEVVAIVPQYRGYRYFVIDDRLCIVDPRSDQIVEVIVADGRTARGRDEIRTGTGGHGLTLTLEERRVLVREIEPSAESTLGLGTVSEGAPAPREARLQSFPELVLQRIPKLKGYRYFTAERQIAIVDPDQRRVEEIVDERL
jgi:hypothetical protein